MFAPGLGTHLSLWLLSLFLVRDRYNGTQGKCDCWVAIVSRHHVSLATNSINQPNRDDEQVGELCTDCQGFEPYARGLVATRANHCTTLASLVSHWITCYSCF